MKKFFYMALVTFAAFVGNAVAKDLPVVKFQDLPGLGNVFAKIASANGYCEKAGIRCELLPIASSAVSLQAVQGGSLTAAYTGHEPTAIAFLRGLRFKSVVGVDMSAFPVLVVRNELPTPNATKGYPAFMTDLKGTKVGVTARGAPTETTMRFMLTQAGMNPDDVTYVAVGAGDTAIGALVSKQVDVLSMFEPTAATCRVTGRCKVLWVAAEGTEPRELTSMNGGGPSMQFTADFIAKNPDIIKAVIQAFSEADKFFNDPRNTDRILQIVKQHASSDSRKENDEVLRILITQGQKRGVFHTRIDRNAVQAVIDYMYSVKLIDSKMKVEDLVYEGAPR